MNSSILLDKLNSTNMQQSATDAFKWYFKNFAIKPLVVGGITVAVVMVVVIFAKQFLDNSETRGQSIIFGSFLWIVVFVITLILLIMIDAGDIALSRLWGG